MFLTTWGGTIFFGVLFAIFFAIDKRRFINAILFLIFLWCLFWSIMAQVTTDMDAIASACLTYESLNVNGKLPASLNDLATGLSATQSIDGVAHTAFIQAGKSTTSGKTTTVSLKDPWGVEYSYSQGARTIACTPQDANGKAMNQIIKSF